MDVKTRLPELAQARYGLELSQCSDSQLYHCLLQLTQELASARPAPSGDRKLYYFSAEFLIGKLLSNNLLALGIYDEVNAILTECGRALSAIEDVEPEPSLGNGGLGRLAACFLDSIAALGLNGDGVGLNYHYGLFEQKFQHNKQTERPNPWIEDESWLIPTGVEFEVPFGFGPVKAKLFDIAVPGAHTATAGRLHLFDVEAPAPAPQEGIDFNKSDLPARLTSFLYPDDSDEAGRLLRVYQQYFMVSNAAQLIIKELSAKGYALRDLWKHAVIQINDTHPSMIIPELIRLMQKDGIHMDEAISIVEKTCAYTNHTILAEALEKWPLHYLQKAVPDLVPIIEELDRRVRKKYPAPQGLAKDEENPNENLYIIDKNGLAHMASMDIHYGFSVNGVAALHTDILKEAELRHFANIYPEKFNNKTNGITFRRWLMHCNPELSAFIT